MGLKQKSPIDELFYSLYGYCPNKAGTAFEMLTDIVYAIINDVNVRHDMKIASNYSNTKYQIDGLVEAKDGFQEMIEAKDYTISNEHVGRDDLQKMQGALTDLDVVSGKFVSATNYTKDAIEYASGTHKNPRQVPIDLIHLRPSMPDDEKNIIKKIVCEINVRGLDFAVGSIKPILGEAAMSFAKRNNITKISTHIDKIYDSCGNVLGTIEEYSRALNEYVKIDDHSQTSISGQIPIDDAFIKLTNDLMFPIDGLEYNIPIYDFNTEFVIKKDGNPVLLIKSHDGAIHKLITDEELKKYEFDKQGNLIKK